MLDGNNNRCLLPFNNGLLLLSADICHHCLLFCLFSIFCFSVHCSQRCTETRKQSFSVRIQRSFISHWPQWKLKTLSSCPHSAVLNALGSTSSPPATPNSSPTQWYPPPLSTEEGALFRQMTLLVTLYEKSQQREIVMKSIPYLAFLIMRSLGWAFFFLSFWEHGCARQGSQSIRYFVCKVDNCFGCGGVKLKERLWRLRNRKMTF